ncbi:MAG: hypothetical protein QOG09_750 [Solirubrobacterales bacterium]|jgi:hypothetical protein|nr:hypothetical protein [Solirubrobacterales bacterium]MDX6662648.1 hypothetical protein [Solirubrobacterales bacterium]
MGRLARSVEKGARKKGFLEPDESVEAAALVGGGSDVFLPSGGTAPGSRWVLAATARNLYTMKLGAIGFRSIKMVGLKIPLADLELTKNKNSFVRVGVRGDEKPSSFRILPFWNTKKLVEYVNSHS